MLDQIKEQLQSIFGPYLKILKTKILGRNNERLDFLIDSFYKLQDKQRTVVVASFSSVVGLIILSITFFYFSNSKELDQELDYRIVSLNEFRTEKIKYTATKNGYDTLLKSVTNKTKNLRLKAFFEKKMKEEKIEYRALETRELEADPTNIIYEKIKEHEIEIRISRISIPKIMSFIVKVEKSPHLIRVKDFRIVGIYGTKLYFDLDVVFSSYQNS
jgi:hypothetical protein